ncbi:MAG: 50S ribosomal protein L9 [Microthrixaceae bacterium]|nr:50S ribosomal protein L9 [Microthrixaceae bacterium]
MKLVLRDNVDGLGKRGDVVEVAPGYARNYLVPRGMAIVANDGIEAQAEAMRRSAALKDSRDREQAEDVAKGLVSRTITIKARAGSGGKLFGSITQTEIVAAIADQAGIEIPRKAVRLDEHIKNTGDHSVQVRLHHDVEFPVSIQVVS